MTGTSTLEVYDADILVAETGMIVCSMQVIKGDVREAILHKKNVNFSYLFCSTGWVPLASFTREATRRLATWVFMTRSPSSWLASKFPPDIFPPGGNMPW